MIDMEKPIKFDRISREQIITCDLAWALMTTMQLEALQPKTRMCVNSVLVQVGNVQKILFRGAAVPVLKPTDYRKYQRVLVRLKKLITEGYGPTVQWDFHNGVIMKVCKICDELEDHTPNALTLQYWKKMVATMVTLCAQMADESALENNIVGGEDTFNRINKIMATA